VEWWGVVLCFGQGPVMSFPRRYSVSLTLIYCLPFVYCSNRCMISGTRLPETHRQCILLFPLGYLRYVFYITLPFGSVHCSGSSALTQALVVSPQSIRSNTNRVSGFTYRFFEAQITLKSPKPSRHRAGVLLRPPTVSALDFQTQPTDHLLSFGPKRIGLPMYKFKAYLA
jgi:hypothetical protein